MAQRPGQTRYSQRLPTPRAGGAGQTLYRDHTWACSCPLHRYGPAGRFGDQSTAALGPRRCDEPPQLARSSGWGSGQILKPPVPALLQQQPVLEALCRAGGSPGWSAAKPRADAFAQTLFCVLCPIEFIITFFAALHELVQDSHAFQETRGNSVL